MTESVIVDAVCLAFGQGKVGGFLSGTRPPEYFDVALPTRGGYR